MNIKLRTFCAGLVLLLLSACGSSFQEGAYANGGVVLEFGSDGRGRLLGGVPGDPGFRYEVKGKQIILSYDGGGSAEYTRVDASTIKRRDGQEFVLRAP